jgi:hypothetical protein
MTAQRKDVDLEGEQSPWKDWLYEPLATAACSANALMEQSLEVGCSAPSPVSVRHGNVSGVSRNGGVLPGFSCLCRLFSGASSIRWCTLRCVLVSGREIGAPVFLVQ